MKLLIVCDPNSVFIYNYIKYVLNGSYNQILIYTFENNQTIKPEYDKFYKENKIEIIIPPRITNFIKRIPKLRGLINIMICSSTLRKLFHTYKHFDIIHFQCANPRAEEIFKRYSNHFSKSITTFWGSDLLRFKRKNKKKLQYILDKSTYVTVATEFMEQTVYDKFGLKYKDKIRYSKFGLPALEHINNLENEESLDDTKRILSIPNDKIVVVCGYNASSAQQHKLMINSLCKCSKEILDKIFVIFPLAYPNDFEYIGEIKSYLINCKFNYLLNTEFLDDLDTARLRIASDIFIHSQISDSFSGSMQEHLYAKNIVFNGCWLEYPILDSNQIYYKKFKDEDDLSIKLSETILNINTEKEKVNQSSSKIYNISSWKIVKDQWLSLYR